jgi:N-acetylneuraminic acid mutarotase
MNKAPMNEMRWFVASATLMDKIYAFGGRNAQERLRSAEIYDPVLDVWGFLPQMTDVRSGAAGVAFNNKIYVIGGSYGNTNQIHTSVEIFNPATNEWSFGPSLQVPRTGAKAIAYNDKIFVIGGYDGTRVLKTVEIYDPLVSPYFQLQDKQLLQERSIFAVTLTDDKIFIMGGYDGRRVIATTEMYDDKDNEWKVSKSMKHARIGLETLTLDHYTLNYKDFV